MSTQRVQGAVMPVERITLLEAVRRLKNISPTKLAEIAGLAHPTALAVLSGAQDVRRSSVLAVASALGVPAKEAHDSRRIVNVLLERESEEQDAFAVFMRSEVDA